MGKIKLNKSFVEYLQYEAQKPKMLDVDSWMIGWNDAVKAIAEIVERGETDLIVRMSYKDAVSVRTGKWIDDNCSECGCYVHHGDVRNFCPNCGADMRGEDDG